MIEPKKKPTTAAQAEMAQKKVSAAIKDI